MIIIEGPDGAGKSTIAKILAGKHGLEIIHAGGPPKDAEDLRGRFATQFRGYGKVLDRASFISEQVYGSVVRNGLLVEQSEIDDTARRFVEKGFFVVYCRPSVDTLIAHAREKLARLSSEKGYKPDNHVQVVSDKIVRIAMRYDVVIENLKRRGMTVLGYVRD